MAPRRTPTTRIAIRRGKPRRSPADAAEPLFSARSGGGCFIGISGYDYAGWPGSFYPPDVPRRSWLAFASRIFNSIELNGTFYSLKSPATFERWTSEVPDTGFV